MDALGAFSYLSDNVPSWNTQLSDIRSHTVTKRQEYIEDFKKHGTVRVRRRKNSSVCSIHTENELQRPVEDSDSEAAVDDEPTRVHPSRIPRKRCLATDDSSISADRTWINSRHNLIIHYDGHTQKALEEIVRNIGTARSNIRRGKMSQLPLAGLRSGGVLSRTMRAGNPSSALLSKAMEPDDPGDGPDKDTKEPPFDSADKLLEVAHSLCETAAYQFLRVGDCCVELDSVHDNFSSLLRLATAEVERLREHVQEEPPEEPPAKAAQPTKRAPDEGEKPQALSGSIEVDDDSSNASVESIDMTAFRANRLNRT